MFKLIKEVPVKLFWLMYIINLVICYIPIGLSVYFGRMDLGYFFLFVWVFMTIRLMTDEGIMYLTREP